MRVPVPAEPPFFYRLCHCLGRIPKTSYKKGPPLYTVLQWVCVCVRLNAFISCVRLYPGIFVPAFVCVFLPAEYNYYYYYYCTHLLYACVYRRR